MFRPSFNHVLVEVDDKEGKWGKGTNENIGGEAYREGKLVEVCKYFSQPENANMPIEDWHGVMKGVQDLIGKHVMWNEGHEAGKTFEEDGKLYALIYWWDIVGVKE